MTWNKRDLQQAAIFKVYYWIGKLVTAIVAFFSIWLVPIWIFQQFAENGNPFVIAIAGGGLFVATLTALRILFGPPGEKQ